MAFLLANEKQQVIDIWANGFLSSFYYELLFGRRGLVVLLMMYDCMESIVRPRLNDYHGILLLQDKVDFAIPFLDEDIS